MPIYEYQCPSCDSVFEEWQSGFEEREMQCPECGQPANRLISHTSFHLKGSGWYVTDYAGKKSGAADACETGGCGAGGCKAGGDDTAGGGADAVPVAKKGSSDTPSAGSAS
jgi:putative FmdB family regulatory protein